ncbi:thymidine phosphorylase [Roseateles toxinivorans]|uniref:Thymidine phosphorylase n=1 Tax=Roseateles toxinivorans TaxID=270368 RepID=A0A4R6QNM8_9BURK|nr:thymidine phosphorylase [Roseateles toxinivorans]TDP71522.1 thymidine phosphorylase [Roseateles toxinivorans]
MLAQEIIRLKRDGRRLSSAQIECFVRGLGDDSWSEAQIAAFAMAVCLRGMQRDECVALTTAMLQSGRVIAWPDLPGPVLDKHSTGGVGDKVSLLLPAMVAACGGFVPMVSGRGLGHTGGTCDKLSAIPGYELAPGTGRFERVVREVGCAVTATGADLAPADSRLYAIRDQTSTIESLPLITASILSKKLASGLQGLVMDVKFGNGAFCETLPAAQELAQSLVEVAGGAGLPTRALISDMNQVLGRTVGNGLEVIEALDYLTGRAREPRLHELTLALGAEMLMLGGLAGERDAARLKLQAALDSGAAAERFARMVAALGGPVDLLEQPRCGLAAAPVALEVLASRAGRLTAMQTREIGLLVLELGGGRRRADDPIDTRVGLSELRALGETLRAGEPLARVHAADLAAAQVAGARLQAACTLSEPGAAWQGAPVVNERCG